MYYLVNSVDCSKFNPSAAPPITIEKKQMQHAGLTSVQQWVADLILDPESIVADALDPNLAKEIMKKVRGLPYGAR